MNVKVILFLNGRHEYTLEFQKYTNEKIIRENDIQKDELSKCCIEILIKDILNSNKNLDFFKGIYLRKGNENDDIIIESKKYDKRYIFNSGFTTSFVETEAGNYLNVNLKNKIIQAESIYDYLKKNDYKNNKNHDKIKNYLIGHNFKVSYAKKNYIIDDILFDRNPQNQSFNYDGKTMTIKDYYKNIKNIDIKDVNQPLILVKKIQYQPSENPKEKNKKKKKEINLFFIPELCHLSGIDDDVVKDREFMQKLAQYTKFTPEDRISKTAEFLKLLTDDQKKANDTLSPKEKCDLYGIKVLPSKNNFKAYQMKETKLKAGNNKIIKSNDKVFPLLRKAEMKKWICVYLKSNYDEAESLYNCLDKASKGFGLKISEPKWIEMNDYSKIRDWKESVEDCLQNGEYDFVVFLLGRNDYLYSELKKHSLCTNGYVSQVVKVNSLKKNSMSVCSKILLQINAKLGGINYKVIMDKDILDSKIMVIGIDSSHIKGKRTCVAMVSTLDNNFSDFYNSEEIIEERIVEKKEDEEEKKEDKKEHKISSFIEKSIQAYKKANKNEKPKNIIIYRQGVSLQQKRYLTNEILNIENICKQNDILFYYILVNTKTNYKFFINEHSKYWNPESGLLVMDGVTNRNFYEFYIQPQLVTSGSATPTCFHVAYGNMNFPEILPKFTYDLCHLYSNWNGAVRMPNVIKAAEKLSKMTAKYTRDKLNENLKFGQAYL